MEKLYIVYRGRSFYSKRDDDELFIYEHISSAELF